MSAVTGSSTTLLTSPATGRAFSYRGARLERGAANGDKVGRLAVRSPVGLSMHKWAAEQVTACCDLLSVACRNLKLLQEIPPQAPTGGAPTPSSRVARMTKRSAPTGADKSVECAPAAGARGRAE